MENPSYDIQGTPFHLLLDELQGLVQHVLKQGSMRIIQHANLAIDNSSLNKSIVNLAQYLALREIDLRPLQERLAEAGLSSLGRAEPHVLANLINVVDMLSRAAGNPVSIKTNLPYPAFREGFDILQRNAETILGKSGNNRSTRIMVTLSSEAATDYQFVANLITEGMDIARINCAHDDLGAWQNMVRNVRRAATEMNSPCRILMDLAGHKIRTGAILHEPAELAFKIESDLAGAILKPIEFSIVPHNHIEPALPGSDNVILPLPADVYARLIDGDRLHLIDARGKTQHIKILRPSVNDVVTGQCRKSLHLKANTQVAWQRRAGKAWQTLDRFGLTLRDSTPGKIHLQAGDVLILQKSQEPGYPARYTPTGELIEPARISCTLPEVIDSLHPGTLVWLDDGKISAYVSKVTDAYAILRIKKTGPKGAKLKADKGLNFPDTPLHLPALTDKDKQDLDFVCRHADMVGFSFVETAAGVRELIAEMQQRGAAHMPIIAKIETAHGVKNLPDILFTAMLSQPLGVMIARGDLAVELGSVRMAEIQEEILWLCEAAHVPVIWATQVLESIAKHGVRSRPEFTDAAMGVRAECVMLNKGPYILEAMRSLNAVLQRMQDHQRKKISRLRALHW